MNLPSGEIWAPAISGSPKKRSRSIIGGRPVALSLVWELRRRGKINKRQQNAKAERLVMVDSFDVRGERQHCTLRIRTLTVRCSRRSGSWREVTPILLLIRLSARPQP